MPTIRAWKMAALRPISWVLVSGMAFMVAGIEFRGGAHDDLEQKIICSTAESLKNDQGVSGSSGAKVRSVSLRVSQRAEQSEVEAIALHELDPIEFSVSSDEAGKLIIHGSSQEFSLLAGKTVVVPFVASHTGRFFMHFHPLEGNRHVPVAAIEVWPR